MYSVIQFTGNDGGTVSVVNSEWLTPRKCEVYWPPVKNSKTFDRLLPSASEKHWQLYNVQRVFYETDNLQKAKQKLKLAEVTSDLQTEEECEFQRPTKRKVFRTNRYISSDEEDENDNHIRPPPLKKHFVNLIPEQTEETRANCSTVQTKYHNFSDADDDNHILTPPLKKKIIISTEEIGVTSTPKHKTSARQNNIINTQDISLPTLPTSLLQNLDGFLTTTESPRLENDNLKLTGYQEKVVELLTLIKIQNDQVLSILKQKKTGVILKPHYKFPLKTSEELEATEELLKNQENYDNLVSYLETLGGRDTSNKVSRIMKTLLTDSLAKEFNFYGKRSQKMPFCHLLLRNCVVESLKNAKGPTEKEIEDNIKVWLKHAPERVLKKEKNK